MPEISADSSFPTADLAPYFRNPRVGNVPLIVESLRAHGQYKPLIVNRGTKTGRPNEVLAGNHLLQAGLKIGLKEMLVHWLDVDDDEAARIVLVDNRASDKGGYDSDALANLLVSLEDLAGTGYSDSDLQRLLNGLEPDDAGGLTDPDAAPELPSTVVTEPGDVWLLGKHRLVCADSRHVNAIAIAAGGQSVDSMWTDPPYGVEYVGKTGDALRISNDGKAGLAELLLHAFQAALTVLRSGAPCYVAHADTERVTFERALIEAGYSVRQNLIWIKNTMVLGRSDYQYKHEPVLELEASDGVLPPEDPDNVPRETSPADDQPEPVSHEPILYGFTPGQAGRLGRGGDQWYGNNKQTTVFEVRKPSASRVHPTMKPVELIVAQLRNSTKRGQTVLDPFAGSGSTLIAAHQLHLVARLVEIDPAYCDVICRRFQEHTSIAPILERTGEPHNFVPEAG